MCNICHSIYHDSQCPEYESGSDRERFCTCELCRENVFVGDKIIDVGEGYVHTACFMKATPPKLFKILGLQVEKAY